MIRILICDDHSIVRKGLKHIIEDEITDVFISEAQNGQEALQLTKNASWDMVILDISMPGMNGLEVLSLLHGQHPKLPILILSMYPEDQYALRVLKAGAAGFQNKQSAPEELVKAIHKILAGGKYISEKISELLVDHLDEKHEKPVLEGLSDREFQTLVLIASGHKLSEIAEKLSLSIKTISTYRSRLLLKLNLENNVELIYFAKQNGLLD